MGKKYTHVVCYTDGSHFSSPDGTGGGLHAVLFNPEDIEDGIIIPDCNEVFTNMGYVKPNKAPKARKMKDGDLVRYDGLLPLKKKTAQYAELSCVLHFFSSIAGLVEQLIDNPTVHIYSDSTYTVNSWNDWMDKWAKKNWTRDGTSPVKNVDVIVPLWELKRKLESLNVKFTISYIPGHKGFYGNERADKLSKEAATYSIQNDIETEEVSWLMVDDTQAVGVEVSEDDKAVAIKKATKKSSIGKSDIVPEITNAKLHYVLSNEFDPTIDVGEDTYYLHMCGNHVSPGKSDDIIFAGKYIPDAMFVVAFDKKPWSHVHEIANRHHKEVWDGVPVMRKYESVVMVHGTHCRRQSFLNACKGDSLPFDDMYFKEQGNSWMFDKLLISRIQRPPLLSYRILDIRQELAENLKNVIEITQGKVSDNIVLNDVTNYFFDENDKPVKTFYRNVDKAFSFKCKQPCSDDLITLRFSRGIGLYDRSGINRVHQPGGKWYVVCIKTGDFTFKYAIAYVGIDNAVYFTAYYRNLRIIKDVIESEN